ncbi:phosphomethylpyrimidine synthase ThiC [Clostridium formicaceticum]|uniref:Phosphomethylpyrimidine synthase n=1 Tax=Clostridium formicaceticum TaxID=1497 RepID=A0AAC9RL55_9CLOT|nr:phosphomethylpyrimidine synthase ThiC [Clostridium formicaceticum]AOY77163.1 phosphomethylpyrimidine synthase [Clostridium formicaceticum]ARE87682.1 Phosphomethylpyrimidine synthase [Clostridium formicaceticum]
MTLLENARNGIITDEMKQVAIAEGVTEEFIRQGIAKGEIVLLGSKHHKDVRPVAVGTGLSTKVSASVGIHDKDDSIAGEIDKIMAAIEAGTDALMDLSVSGDIDGMRKEALAATTKPIGTLPLYQALADAKQKRGSSLKMTVDDLFEVIEKHAAEGIDFLALHCGTTMDIVARAKREGRIDPLVSFGGAHLIGWMIHNEAENPLYENFDRLLEIARKYDVVLSFADGMRPGCLADSLDGAQVHELVILGELVTRARNAGVQVMVKGPGHVPIDEIETTVKLQKSLCKGAPYFVFGPLVTDSAVGFDHISAAIGGAISAFAGAEFLCYVTPAEHVGLPNKKQVYDGVIASRIAAHAADVAKGIEKAIQWDLEMSQARRNLDWEKQMELSIDPETARRMWKERSDDFSSECTMCGKYCAMKIVSQFLNKEKATA